MSAGLISLSAGALIGLLYGLLKVRSPAPPALALVGLLGMLAGESLMGQVCSLSRPPTLGFVRRSPAQRPLPL